MNQMLAFWVHPRSISTGFELIFIERGDFKVLHEPFSALYYVYEKRIDCPGQHINPNAPMSYPDITSEEIGIELAYKLFMKVREITGETPIVIDADELEDNPDGDTRAYCDAVGIPFIPDAMHWEAGRHIEAWDSWKEWHVDATESSGIQKNMETFDFGLDDKPNLRDYFEYHLPFYQALFAYRVSPN